MDRSSNSYVGAPDIPLSSKCYWEYLSESGKEVGIIGVPLNAPPREVNGKVVLGGPYADEESYTYPPELRETIEDQFDYQLHPTTDPASAEEPTAPEVVEELETMIHQRFDVGQWMLNEDTELLNISLFYINHLQHMAWDSPEVKSLWEVIDKRLGKLLEDDHRVIIHSDHGLHEVEHVFYLNSWLHENGYLELKKDGDSARNIRELSQRVSDRIVNTPPVNRILPNGFVDRFSLSTSGKIVDPSEFEASIDFDTSKAVGLPHGLVYVLDDDRKLVTSNLKKDLKQVSVPDSSKSAFKDVVHLDDVYSQWDESESPDLFVRWNEGVEVKDVNDDDPSTIFGPPQKFKADNAQEGILLAAGPEIGDSELDKTPRLYDIAPTLLHLAGGAVPTDMDGKVIKELFQQGSRPREESVEWVEGTSIGKVDSQSNQDVEDRLKDLGYLE